MQTTVSSHAGVVTSQLDNSILHDLQQAPTLASPQGKPGDDELRLLRERASVSFQELEPRLRAMIDKRISTRLKGRVDVDDILQNAFRSLMKSLETRRPKSDGELTAWIFKKTWSRWQDELRTWSTDARNVCHEDPLPSGSDVALVGGIGVATHFGLKETVDRIREALHPIDFQIVELRIVDEFSYKEIAELLNLTPESVRKRFTRALLKIKHAISSPFSSSS